VFQGILIYLIKQKLNETDTYKIFLLIIEKNRNYQIKMKDDKIEFILVFTKNTGLRKAKTILDKIGVTYREGMDSSRGKIYFYNTGPKFILTFETEEEKSEFESKYQDVKEIHEIYTPDWTIQKD